ncbi:MAG: tyrosine-type recombinase/integrase [Candidatus Methylomirabilia bacterium]
MKRIHTLARRAPHKLLDVTKKDLVAFAIDRARVMAERQGRPGGHQSLVPLLRSRGWALFVKDARDFYGWLERQGLIGRSQNPVRGLHVLPSRPRQVPAQILRQARHYDTLLHHPALNVRERVVMTLLAHGLTPSQTASLQVADVALAADPVQVRIKSRWHTRVVPVSDRAVNIIRPWVMERRQGGHPWVLPNGQGGHVTPRAVRAVVYRAARRVFCHPSQRRIRETISPSGFRELFIVRALKAGVSVDILMALIGLSARRLRPYLAQTAPQERLHTEFRRIIRRWRNWL